jgi:predicted transcriptional regulator
MLRLNPALEAAILVALKRKEMNIRTLAAQTGLSITTVRKYAEALAKAGKLIETKKGRARVFSISKEQR